jgi:hypothetical protein
MKTLRLAYLSAIVILVTASPCSAKKRAPGGVLAASVGDTVVLIEPNAGLTATFRTGPVGWLFPAPGGILFAPDVVNGTTTVINLRSQTVAERVDGITMPHFGTTPDRYTAIADEVITLSYPDRAVMARIPARIAHPWQVIVAPDDAAMLILERLPDGSTGIHMTTVNLITRQVVYRRPLRGDIRHIALSPRLGILALADADADKVHLVEPSTLTPMAARPTPGHPVDVAFTHEDQILATAVDTGDGAGLLDLALFKIGKKGHRLDKEFSIPLNATPVRLAASPGGSFVAVAMEGGLVSIVDIDHREIVTTGALAGPTRDLRWCDPSREGPMMPNWSDGEPDLPDFGTFVPKVKDGQSSGLEEPVWQKPPN